MGHFAIISFECQILKILQNPHEFLCKTNTLIKKPRFPLLGLRDLIIASSTNSGSKFQRKLGCFDPHRASLKQMSGAEKSKNSKKQNKTKKKKKNGTPIIIV